MKTQTASQLAAKKCQPCEGGVAPLWPQEASQQLAKLKGWGLGIDGQRIRKSWVCKDFAAAMKFINDIAKLANQEDHHPDLHLTDFRNVVVETSTHSIGGLSENDFILAAKIDSLPVQLKVDKKKK
jgi:4a-hydroxytetrahydrobiopterin dehydratase